MTIVFRQLHAGDREEYLTLMLAAYKPIYALGIPFDAATATLEKVTQHIAEHGVYAVFSEGVMRASVTIRYPCTLSQAHLACRISVGLARTRITRIAVGAEKFRNGSSRIF